MGACNSACTKPDPAEDFTYVPTEQRKGLARDLEVTAELEREKIEEEEVLKLLLLGPGGSGKSTLFKQIINIYGQGMGVDARKPYISIIYSNIIVSMKTLIKQSQTLDEQLGCMLLPENSNDARTFSQEIKLDQEVDVEVGQIIERLWADPGIQETYCQRSRFELADACKWYFENITRIGREDFLPTNEDVLRVRARTTGIVETCFTIEGHKFRLLDVGGQRSERKKWFHCFEDVTAVLFVAAINEFDQTLFEDLTTNRLHESLTLFGEICNSRWFYDTSMILFLNKRDLFREKIATVDLNVCFEAYTGGKDYDNAIHFVTDMFVSKNDFAETKEVYVHITNATSQENIAFAFNVVKDIIIRAGLKDCGLIGY